MLTFVRNAKRGPTSRSAEERRHDFAEIYKQFDPGAAETQASRCSQCGVPFCQSGCPLGNNIPDWLKRAADGDLEAAYALSAETSALPEICGRICPQDRLCEGSCVIEQAGHGTVTIGAIEQHITDAAWEAGLVTQITPAQERSQTVGIIGAGPAGLAAADRLRTEGFGVTIYDRYDRPGGLLTYGIPGFKLEKDVVLRRAERLAASGVVFQLNTEIGAAGAPGLPALRTRHDAVLIATGVYRARPTELVDDGADAPTIVKALDYLTTSNRKGFGDDVPDFSSGALNADGKRVLVLGGGDTAMDCVRTAVRQGATSVTCAYRRDRENMPGSAREVRHAEEEGVLFDWLTTPTALQPGPDGAAAVSLAAMRLGPADRAGRRRPEKIPEQTKVVDADLVIAAFGFLPEDLPRQLGAPTLPVRKDGTIKAHHATRATAMPGVFAAGDITRGASLVVWAVKEGQDAAAGITDYLLHEKTSTLAITKEPVSA